MKSQEWFAPSLRLFVGSVIVWLFGFQVNAQSYSIDWYKLAAGGGTSTGGVYSISGTIGQHDAGPTIAGGGYSLTSGYWALFAAQTPGAPQLSIQLTVTNTAIVFWPSPSTGWTLQANTSLVSTNWAAPSEIVQNNGSINYIIVNSPAGSRFYRLKHP